MVVDVLEVKCGAITTRRLYWNAVEDVLPHLLSFTLSRLIVLHCVTEVPI